MSGSITQVGQDKLRVRELEQEVEDARLLLAALLRQYGREHGVVREIRINRDALNEAPGYAVIRRFDDTASGQIVFQLFTEEKP